jgi:hypothetical protein
LRHREHHADGLAVGVVFYETGTGSHAVNWSVGRAGGLWFLDARTAKEVVLSETELSSVFFVYC